MDDTIQATRKIDFQQCKKSISGRIVTIELDPNQNARTCPTCYGDGEKRYFT